jgi:hypothetical protein
VAFYIKEPEGHLSGGGVFFQGADERLLPVALPQDLLPNGDRIVTAWYPSLNDSGVVAFIARPEMVSQAHPYWWENGQIAPLPVERLPLPERTVFVGMSGVWVNNRNRNTLLAPTLETLIATQGAERPAQITHAAGNHYSALYLLADGAFVPVATSGQSMPGGGTFLTLQTDGVSPASETGEHAFLAWLEDGSTAAYRMAADGTVSLIVRSGTMTNLGRVAHVGEAAGRSWGVGLNQRGEVALSLRVEGGADRLVLLRPAVPPR